jgi:hypothetical protein
MAEKHIPLTGAGYAHLQKNPQDARALQAAAISFREFLNYWYFIDQESGRVRCLGHELWEAQEEFVRATLDNEWIFYLKARKLGETTIGCAFDGWVVRFRDPLARVHLFSRRDDAAQELLSAVKYGLKRLPPWMQLPIVKDTTHEFILEAGPDDRRMAKAYPADKETAVEATCTHGHVDEWARMANPQKVWQAIEPSMAGTCHFITTGLGPTNWTSQYWRKCMSGDAMTRHGSPVHACFLDVLKRPGRDEAWLRGMRAGMDEQHFRQEYPLTWEDALSGGGEFAFKGRDINAAGIDFRGLGPAVKGRKYVKSWDIGRHQDAAVGVVLDITDEVQDVVHYVRLRENPYPFIQAEIEATHRAYPGPTVIEKNAAGEAVIENLNIPEYEVEGWTTSNTSKARIISKLDVALQNQLIKWDPNACSQLDAEVRGYQIPDDHVVQDSVMALAIGHEYSETAHLLTGRIRGVIRI